MKRANYLQRLANLYMTRPLTVSPNGYPLTTKQNDDGPIDDTTDNCTLDPTDIPIRDPAADSKYPTDASSSDVPHDGTPIKNYILERSQNSFYDLCFLCTNCLAFNLDTQTVWPPIFTHKLSGLQPNP